MVVSTPLLTRWLGLLLLAGLLTGAGGCTWDQLNPFARPDGPAGPAGDSLVLRSDGLVTDAPRVKDEKDDKALGQLAAARELFRTEQYAKAEELFYHVAEMQKISTAHVQEAMYYRAECLRLQGYYPKAADLYVDLLNKFPQSSYREQCVQHMFAIADYWLDDTRQEMREDAEKRQGKRWFVWPRFVSFERTKPLLDREGRAVEKLEQVRLHDLNGPLADRALFMCGTVKLFNENFREADHYFSQIAERHPNSKLAPKAVELAIYCKHMSTGGSDYDGRKTAEARKLVQTALTTYPELAREKQEFLMKQLVGINLQQAEKDYKAAEFWRRTGHPGSAYFYYDMVRRRYPGTKYANLSAERMNELRGKLEKEQARKPPDPRKPERPEAPAPKTNLPADLLPGPGR
jgi:outer membrane protein assembly factor BamD (BamD/ComL family)